MLGLWLRGFSLNILIAVLTCTSTRGILEAIVKTLCVKYNEYDIQKCAFNREDRLSRDGVS